MTRSSTSTSIVALLCMAGLAAAGCGGDPSAQGTVHSPQAAPAIPVKIVTLEQRPIARASEFIASIRSLQSTTVQPEVEGIVRRILVKSGDRVRPGMPLVQIDAERQEASVRSIEAGRAGTQADVEYWRQQVARLDALVGAGAISRQEFDQAQNSLRTAEARLAAFDAQLREGQVQLRYYRVTAPQAGVIGDIPIREGDRVTSATVLTTINANQALEAHIDVPLERAPELRVGLPVELLNADGAVIEGNAITFVSPRVDPDTQAVLAKVVLENAPPSMRDRQFIRARVIWSTSPGVTVPVVAVTRISSQYFCFVAEPQGAGLVARQRPLTVGEIQGEDYVVVRGLSPGDRVIVSGVQKLGDGAPVQAE